MAKKRVLIDLSQEIYQGMPVYPGDPKTVIWEHHTHEETAAGFKNGFSYANRGLLMGDHGSTHVDAINHINPAPHAPSIDQLPLEMFYTEAICLDFTHIEPDGVIDVADLEEALREADLEIKPGEAVLLYTGHYDRQYGKPEWFTRHPGLTRRAALWLCDKGVVNLGIDAPSVDNPKDPTNPCHMLCRERSFVITENLANLDKIVGKRVLFAAFPLRIRNGTGSPVRAVAILEE